MFSATTVSIFMTNTRRDLLKYGGTLAGVNLGDTNQVAIEKEYWKAFTKAKQELLVENAMESTFLSLWGFPVGIIVWIFYRLVQFAVKG